jgi:hypothetical protein
MSLPRVVLVLSSTLALAGCASSNLDLVPIPSTDGPLARLDGKSATLQLRVQNQGSVPADASPVAIEFFLRSFTATSAIQDGGRLQSGETSSVLEFEIPQGCLEGGCEFQVAVDPEKTMKDENRSNNLARGRIEGAAVSKYTPTLGTPRP